MEYIETRRYWLVGMDGTDTAVPDYFFDRWEVIYATYPGQAITQYANRQQIPTAHVGHIEVWHVSETTFSTLQWLHEHVEWTGKNQARMKVRPLGEAKAHVEKA